MSKPTIYTIAEQCGVSHATVSMALRNNPLVAVKTKERIQKVADEVGYRPNRLALSLKTGMSNVIGVVIPSFTYPYHSLIAEYIFREATRQGYQVQFVLSGSDLEQESRAIMECLDAQVDGLIVRSVVKQASELPDDHALRTVLNRKIPCVMGNNPLGVSGAMLAHARASTLAVRHLLKMGYDDIRLLQLGGGEQGDSKFLAAEQSISGFQAALQEAGRTYDPSMLLVHHVVQSEEGISPDPGDSKHSLRYIEYDQFDRFGSEMMEQVLRESDGGRIGLVFGHDRLACAAWRYCISNRIRVPQDVGIVGRGDIQTYMMSLTTIGWDYEEQAKQMVSILISQIRSGIQSTDVQVEPYLAARGSTASAQ